MRTRRDSVGLARLFYGIVAVVALILAIGVLWPAIGGAPGGCQVVLAIGAEPAASDGAGNPAPQPPAANGGPGLASDCRQYVDLLLPIVALILALILLVTVVRLGREPSSWGPVVAVGVSAGMVAGVGAARAILGVASSDQPQSSPGPGLLLIAAVPVIGALGSAFAVWRGRAQGRTAPGT